MNRMLKSAAALLCAAGISAHASTSAITATVTDTDGTPWASATYTAIIHVPGQPNTRVTIGGVPVTSPCTTSSPCVASSSGVITGTYTDTSSVDQANARWVFTIKPNASADPVNVSVAIIGATPNLTANFSSVKAPRFPAGPSAYGYADAEVTNPALGSTYFNTASACGGSSMRQYSNSGWQCGGGGSGKSGTVSPQGQTLAAGSTYTQLMTDGTTQIWDVSSNAAVATNRTTGQVVYVGPAQLMGVDHVYEMNEGSGTTLSDSVGSTNLSFGPSGQPTWNGTNGLTYNGGNNQYVSVPQSFWTQHSTYLICINISSINTSSPGNLLGVTGTDVPGILLDAYGTVGINTASSSMARALQPVTVNTPVCTTTVYNGAGQDQFWFGSTKLALKNSSNSLVAATGGLGLGGYFHGLQGTIYKFATAIGTELPGDIIQHNALVETARIASATGLNVATGPAGYKLGTPPQWCIGDSITSGNGFLPNTYCYNLQTDLNVPGVTVLNGGTAGQTLANYVSQGIFNQAATLISQYALPGSTAPPHFAGLYMGVNDINAGTTGASLYSLWKQAVTPLYSVGWKTIGVTLTPSAAMSSANDAQRQIFNSSLLNGGQANYVIDWANDLRMMNPAYPQINNGSNIGFGVFDPYYQDAALHPSALGGAALHGRYLNAMNQQGEIGKGAIYTVPFASTIDIDMSRGHSQALTLTGNVTSLKVINGNQGDTLDLTICQDATGGRTVTAPAVGAGATATTTSAGVLTLTANGSNYDSNYLPVFYVSGLTCSTYPAYQATITSGTVASISAFRAGSGCSGTGTVTVVPTEPTWNHFNTSGVNGLAAGACLAQHFVFDDKAQSIN